MGDPYFSIVQASRDFITLIDGNYRYVFVNDSYARALEQTPEEIQGRSVADVWGQARFEGAIEVPLKRCLGGEEVHFIDEFPFGESVRYVEVSFYPYTETEGGPVTHALVFSHDITRLGELESRLMDYEFRDPATGLFNRRSLDIVLEREIEKARRDGEGSLRGLLFLVIENLGDIRRLHGEEVARIVLENTGLRVKDELRGSDYVFRYEADELAVLLGTLRQPTDVVVVGEKLHAVATLPYSRGEYEIRPECRLGIALYPRDADDRGSLIDRAAAALTTARDEDKAFQLYDEDLHNRSVEKQLLVAQMRKGLYEDRFELFFQPIVDPAFSVVGAEALLRWRHPRKGLLAPGIFIPLAEESGLIVEMEKQVIFAAARFLEEWSDSGIYLSINLSARLFEDPELGDLLDNARKKFGSVSADRLKLEITESEGLRNPELALQRMASLRKKGYEIFIDDFGTGQSSLGYLKDIPATALKIDRAFVDGIENDEEDRACLSHIIDLIKTRHRKVVIEGVENAAQAAILGGLGIDALQGFYFAKPMPPEEFTALLGTKPTLP